MTKNPFYSTKSLNFTNMTLTTRLTSLVLGLASLKLAAGAAIAQPEVVPGPGLPSLEQLGLTSAELYSLGKPNISMRGNS